MNNSSENARSILRLIGVVGIGVGAAWALQILGFGGDSSSPLDRVAWVMAAAGICGASFGLIVVSGALEDTAVVRIEADGHFARN